MDSKKRMRRKQGDESLSDSACRAKDTNLEDFLLCFNHDNTKVAGARRIGRSDLAEIFRGLGNSLHSSGNGTVTQKTCVAFVIRYMLVIGGDNTKSNNSDAARLASWTRKPYLSDLFML